MESLPKPLIVLIGSIIEEYEHFTGSNPQSTSTTLQVRHCYSFNITGIVFFGGDKISKAIA